MDECAATLARMESLEADGGEFVLAGDPSSGRTAAVIESVRARPVIAKSAEKCYANVVVVHFSAVSDLVRRAKSAGIQRVVPIRTRTDFAGITDTVACSETIFFACIDVHFARLCQSLHALAVQRIVFDNLDALRGLNYPIVSCHAKWFVCTPELLDRPRPRARAVREARLAHAQGRTVLAPRARAGLARDAGPELVMYRETTTAFLVATVNALYRNGRESLAAACLPCQNIRTADAPRILGDAVSAKLGDACPICLEDAGPRLVVPCCNNNFCAECLARHLASRGTSPRTCPMCRAGVDIHSCMIVSETVIPRVRGIVLETKSLIRRCLRDANAKVLVVAGAGIDNAVADLMWHTETPYIDIRGNSATIEKRLNQFRDESLAARVAVVRNHNLRFAPIRTPALTHVVFVGFLTRREQAHWETRGAGPQPKTFSIESVYDAVFKIFE